MVDKKEITNQFGPSSDFSSGNMGTTIETDFSNATVSVPDNKDTEKGSFKYSPLLSYIQGRFQRSKDRRLQDEERWLDCYRNYRGIYGPQVQFTDTEKSRVFMKITKTKVLASYAQIIDILFSGAKFPIGVESTTMPEGIAKEVHVDAGQQGAPQPSTIARKDIFTQVGPYKDRLEGAKDKLQEGPGLLPDSITWSPSMEAARRMTDQIQDQLEEAGADKSIRSFVFEMCLFGHGVMKGPLLKLKEYPKWTEEGKYEPVTKKTADINFVSIWDSYPDSDATNIDDSEYFIQRHRLNKSQMRELKKRPYFRADSIDAAIQAGFNYQEEYWESQIKDYELRTGTERYEVLEYWGNIDKEMAEELEVEIPPVYKDKDQIQINAWICNGHLLRLVFNPFTPARIPYHACPYELNPYSFFGIGLAENMSDSQLLMNGFMRMAVDNGVLSSNIILEVNENSLAPGQDMKLYPGKIFKTQGANQQPVIRVNKIDNVTQEALALFDKARQLADESTGMPSYAHGQGGIQGIGRTAAGMSMLMGAAKENIKAVVRNIDDFLLIPLGKAIYAFNMQFNFDKDYIGDLDVIALGTTSLMRNEVRSQKILQYLQVTANPMDAPFVKRDFLLRELAECLDIESDKAVNDPRQAALQAVLMKEMMLAQGIDPNAGKGPPGAGNPAGAPQGSDPTGTGGGNIAPGNAPSPGEQGFSAPGGGLAPGNGE